MFGIVAAGIAIGVELGSATAGVIAVVGALALVLGATVALVWAAREDDTGDERRTDTPRTDRHPDQVERLKRRYLAGEIDEATFEERVETLLGGESDAGEVGGEQIVTEHANQPIESTE